MRSQISGIIGAVLLLYVFSTGSVDGIQCYTCGPVVDKNDPCAEDFDPSEVPSPTCQIVVATCMKEVRLVNGTEVSWKRACLRDADYCDTSSEDRAVYCCNTDRCNHSSHMMAPLMTILSMAGLVLASRI